MAIEPPETKDKGTILEHTIRRLLPGLWEHIRGGPDVVLLESVKVSRTGTSWLCVGSGRDLSTMGPVVVFGSGERLWEALRNLSLAMAKRQWKRDRYRT